MGLFRPSLEDLPDGEGGHGEAMEVRSSTFDELDLAEAEASASAEPDRSVSRHVDLTIPDRVDLTIPDLDEASLLLPTPADDNARPKARHRGLEALERVQKRRNRTRRLMMALVVLIVGGGGFAATYLGFVEIPGVTPAEWSRFYVPAPAALPGPQSDAPVMSHAIFIDTWRETETLRAWADALQVRMPELLGFVTPVSVDGDLQYALLVGPAYNSAEADGLKAPLAVAFELLNPDPAGWAVREAPYSFFLGEYETLEEANGRVQTLADLSIPAFVLRVTYPDQAGAHRVYSGAYSDEVQAEAMGRLLGDSDLNDAPFTELRGRPPY